MTKLLVCEDRTAGPIGKVEVKVLCPQTRYNVKCR